MNSSPALGSVAPPAKHLVDTELPRHLPRRGLVVSAEQHDLEPHRLQLRDGLVRGRFDGIGHDEHGPRRAVPPGADDRPAIALARSRGRLKQWRHRHPVPAEQLRPPGDDLAAVDLALDSESGMADEAMHDRRATSIGCRRGSSRDCTRDRMPGFALQRPDQPSRDR